MAKGANGTIDLDNFTQLQRQREALRTRNRGGKVYGVANDRLTEAQGALFPNSPLLLSNRAQDSQDRSGLFEGTEGDIYKAFANAVDSSDPINGFGFEEDQVNLNYQHENNPLKNDVNALTTGKPAEEIDNFGSTKRYVGFPDLKPQSDLSVPQEVSGTEATAGLEKESNENFGSSVVQDRAALNQIYSVVGSGDNEMQDQRGTYESDAFSVEADSLDTVGKYFKNVMIQE